MRIAKKTIFERLQLQHLSINKLIQWGDHFSVDHPTVDAQHKAIFDLGTKVYENWRAGAGVDALRASVDKVAKLLEVHFAYEEKLLAEIEYLELEQHAREHDSMLNEIKEIQEYFQSIYDKKEAPGGSVLAPGWSVVQLLLGFTIGHVATSDMSYYRSLVDSRQDRPQ